MKHITLLVWLVLGSSVFASGPSEEVLLRARVAQLEAMLLGCQVAPVQQAQAASRAAIEKDAKCVIDWNATTPVCVPGSKKGEDKAPPPTPTTTGDNSPNVTGNNNTVTVQ